MNDEIKYESKVLGNWGVEIGQTTTGYVMTPKRMKSYLKGGTLCTDWNFRGW